MQKELTSQDITLINSLIWKFSETPTRSLAEFIRYKPNYYEFENEEEE